MFGKKVVVHLQGQVQWEVLRNAQTGRYVGICRSMNLNASGDSMPEFLEAATEVMDLLLDKLLEAGEFEAFLQRRGFRAVTDASGLPTRRADVRWDVPFEVMQRSRMDELVPA